MITLYHGTTSVIAQKIKQVGMRAGTCLTTDVKLAYYYAECALEEDESDDEDGELDIALVKVVLPLEALEVDYPSFEEPISIYRDNFASSEREWHAMLEDGSIPYPSGKDDVQIALDVTTSVKTKNNIEPKELSFGA
jgi:hypothetical protein